VVWKLRLTTTAALLLVAVAGIAIIVFLAFDALDSWAPNVATEALSIAITVAVVERIVRREEREHDRPRVKAATEMIGTTLHSLATQIALDYVETHVESEEVMPNRVADIVSLWRRGVDDLEPPEREPPILGWAEQAADRLRRSRELDSEVLEPRLVVALDDAATALPLGRTLYALGTALDNHPRERHKSSVGFIVKAVSDFLDVYRQMPDAELEVSEVERQLVRQAREAFRQQTGGSSA
jgi:hypothetical protein